MKIALIDWGCLVWDRRRLDVATAQGKDAREYFERMLAGLRGV